MRLKDFFSLFIIVYFTACRVHASAPKDVKVNAENVSVLKYSALESADFIPRCVELERQIVLGEKVKDHTGSAHLAQPDIVAAVRRLMSFYHMRGDTIEVVVQHCESGTQLNKENVSLNVKDLIARAMVLCENHALYGQKKPREFITKIFNECIDHDNDLAARCSAFHNAVKVGQLHKNHDNIFVQGLSQSNIISSARRVVDFYHQNGGTVETFLQRDAGRFKFKNNDATSDLIGLMGDALALLYDHSTYKFEKIVPFIAQLFKDVQDDSLRNQHNKLLLLLDKIRGGSAQDVAALLAREEIDLDQALEMDMTPIFYAVLHDKPDVVAVLLKHRASINWHMKKGLIPLMVAPSQEMQQFLLKQGADINDTDCSGDTPLMYAAKNRRPKTAKVALDLGANVDAQGKDGQTALHCTVAHLEPIDTRMIRNVLLGLRDSGTPADDIFHMLTERNASCQIADNNGVFPFMIAIEKINLNFFNTYFSLKRIPLNVLNTPDHKGRVALSIASTMIALHCRHSFNEPCDHKALALLLTTHGAHVNGVKGQKPPIFVAIDSENCDEIEALCRAGLDFQQTFAGKTMQQYAKERLEIARNQKLAWVLEQMKIGEERNAKKKEQDERTQQVEALRKQKLLRTEQKKKEEEQALQKRKEQALAFKAARDLAKQQKKEAAQKKIDEDNALLAQKQEAARSEQAALEAAQAKAALTAQEQAAKDKVKKEEDKRKAKSERRAQKKLDDQKALAEMEHKRKIDEDKALRAFAASQAARFVRSLSDKAIAEYEKELELKKLEEQFVAQSDKKRMHKSFAQWLFKARKLQDMDDQALTVYGKKLAKEGLNTWKQQLVLKKQQKIQRKAAYDALVKMQTDEFNRWTQGKAKIVLAQHMSKALPAQYVNPLIEAQMQKDWHSGNYFGWFNDHLDHHINEYAFNYLSNKELGIHSASRAHVACGLCASCVDIAPIEQNLNGLHSTNFEKTEQYRLAAVKVKFAAFKRQRESLDQQPNALSGANLLATIAEG